MQQMKEEGEKLIFSHCLTLHRQHSHSYLEPPGEELVLDFQEVASVHLSLERLIEDGELHIVLDVLPAGVTVSEGSLGQGQQLLRADNNTDHKTTNPPPIYIQRGQ